MNLVLCPCKNMYVASISITQSRNNPGVHQWMDKQNAYIICQWKGTKYCDRLQHDEVSEHYACKRRWICKRPHIVWCHLPDMSRSRPSDVFKVFLLPPRFPLRSTWWVWATARPSHFQAPWYSSCSSGFCQEVAPTYRFSNYRAVSSKSKKYNTLP